MMERPMSDGRPSSGDLPLTGVEITFNPFDGGMEIIDTSDRRRYTLHTDDTIRPRSTDRRRFLFPVDDARTVDVSSISFPTVVPVVIRDDAGTSIARTDHFSSESLPHARYQLEVSAPIKIHMIVDAPITVESDAHRTWMDFDGRRSVHIGVQSKHDRPIATVTTTTDVEDMMRAISTFGSALKTTSPERSYPTFRGHPPTVELGEQLTIPDSVRPPETGIQLQLPAKCRYPFVAAPLSYYLGARVEPGSEAKLLTDTGLEVDLGTGLEFERQIERILKQTFLLDCVTRTEGLYQISLHERDHVEQLIDTDLATLYEIPIASRLETYLSLPFESIKPFIPEWKLTTHVSPVPKSIETLPYVVNDLAVIRTPQWAEGTNTAVAEAAIGSFLRDSFVRSTAAHASPQSFVELERADSIEQAWVGDETPLGVSKAMPEAYQNRFDRRPSAGSIEITVVCNDPQMDEERGLVDRSYGTRLELPFDVDVHHGLTCEELRTELEQPTDLLHYIGHIDDDGFKCSDGMLDAATLDEVGIDAFVLNACQSYEQGMYLIDNGAIGGIATLSTVINSGAVRIGSAVARLLNCGFPLRAALEIAKDESIIGGSYIVIGDGGLTVAQPESGTPNLCEVKRLDDDSFEVTIRTYPTTAGGMGGVFMPIIASNSEYFLNSGAINTFQLSMDELADFLCLEDIPVKIDGELHWSRELDLEEL